MGFQQGLSGLNSTSKNLEVISNNIANANTFGAKSSRAEFADMYAGSLNGNGASTVGIGVQVAAVAQQFSQGNISATDNTMDLAINGRGFFMLQDAGGKEVYSRNGQMKRDRNDTIVNAQGFKLLGKPWNETVSRGEGAPQPIVLPSGGGDAIKTGAGAAAEGRGVRVAMNFDAGKAIIPAATPRVRFDSPTTYNYSTSQSVYDGQGNPLVMTYYFQKTDLNKWSVFGAINGVPFNQANGVAYDPTSDDPDPIIKIEFDADGKLTTASPTEALMTVNDPRVPANPAVLFTDLPFKLTAVTQFGAPFAISELKQDGFAFGKLTGVTFDSNGIVKATYSNGRFVNLYELQLADFPNVQGLKPLGGNAWEATYASGAKVVNAPGASSTGEIQSGALEESNVDLTAELVNMITAQRMYQANAQSIQTTSETLQTLLQIR